MQAQMDDVLRRSAIFRRLTPDDRQRLAVVAVVREFHKGAMLFREGDASDFFW
jgi:CRP-like cAMP-binding protein